MKKLIFGILLSLISVSGIYSQDWLTSPEVAKKLALMQDKMIFAVWEDAMYKSNTPVLINGNMYPLAILASDESKSRLIWKYFVPLIIPEYKYKEWLNEIDGKRNLEYMYKFNDNYIKILDANGNILNTKFNELEITDINLAHILEKYSVRTSYLKNELKNYSLDESFNTTFRLASKYQDFAIYANKFLKKEIIDLSEIYMKEAKEKLKNESQEKQDVFLEKMKLLDIKENVILNNPKKALRRLKRLEKIELDDTNLPLFSFLHFASYRLLNDIDNAMIWQNKVSLADLKKVKYLIQTK